MAWQSWDASAINIRVGDVVQFCVREATARKRNSSREEGTGKTYRSPSNSKSCHTHRGAEILGTQYLIEPVA